MNTREPRIIAIVRITCDDPSSIAEITLRAPEQVSAQEWQSRIQITEKGDDQSSKLIFHISSFECLRTSISIVETIVMQICRRFGNGSKIDGLLPPQLGGDADGSFEYGSN